MLLAGKSSYYHAGSIRTPQAAYSAVGCAERRSRYNKTAIFRNAEPLPHINHEIVCTRRFAPVNISQSLVVCCKEQAFGNCSSDLMLSAFGLVLWLCVLYRWVWVCFQHARKLLQSIGTSSRYLSQRLVNLDSCQYPGDIVRLEVGFLDQGQQDSPANSRLE